MPGPPPVPPATEPRPGEGGLLAVHAHPDDETLVSGATLARYAARGVPVTLVTATRGEGGEVIPAELAHLEGRRPELARRRVGELAEAMRRLGVVDHHFLGAPVPGVDSRFPPRVHEDSGMAYAPDGSVVPAPDAVPDALTEGDPADQAERLAEIIVARRPRAVLTYDPGGGYGHPDHVRTHEVTMAAVEVAAGAGHAVPKVYWAAVPATEARRRRTWLADRLAAGGAGLPAGARLPAATDPVPSMVMPDDVVTTALPGTPQLRAAKAQALRAHATQVEVAAGDDAFVLSNRVLQVLDGREWYRLVRGEPAGRPDPEGRETDLLA